MHRAIHECDFECIRNLGNNPRPGNELENIPANTMWKRCNQQAKSDHLKTSVGNTIAQVSCINALLRLGVEK